MTNISVSLTTVTTITIIYNNIIANEQQEELRQENPEKWEKEIK